MVTTIGIHKILILPILIVLATLATFLLSIFVFEPVQSLLLTLAVFVVTILFTLFEWSRPISNP